MNFVVEVSKADLIDEINFHLSQIPSSSLQFDVKTAGTTQIKKLRIKDLELTSQQLDAALSAIIIVKKSTVLTDVKAEGEIQIKGYLAYSIDSEWQLKSNFWYTGHTWLDSPEVNIGLIQFSVKSIIDNVVENQKSKLESVINEQLKGLSDLSSYLKPMLPHINQAIKFKTTQLHILPNITEVIIESVEDDGDTILIHCTLDSETRFKLKGKKEPEATLPKLKIVRERESQA